MVEKENGDAGVFPSPAYSLLQPPTTLDTGPGTIESGDEIDNFSGSGSESEDEVRHSNIYIFFYLLHLFEGS